MKKSKNNSKLKMYIIFLVVAAVVGALLFLRKSLISPQVALISSDERPPSCTTLVDSITLQKECDEGYYQGGQYQCKDGTTYQRSGSEKCETYTSILAEAQTKCGQICDVVVRPSSRPNPTCVPNPCTDGAKCKLAALPEGQVYCAPVNSVASPTPAPSNSPIPSGCYYQQVQCIQAPCNPMLVCNTTSSPTPRNKPLMSTAPIPVTSPIAVASASPTCAKQVSTWKYRESCGNGNYRYIDFNCIGDRDLITYGSNYDCKSEANWLNEAKTACRMSACPTTTASSTPQAQASTRPTPKPIKQDFWSCYRACRASNNRSLYGCINSCRAR